MGETSINMSEVQVSDDEDEFTVIASKKRRGEASTSNAAKKSALPTYTVQVGDRFELLNKAADTLPLAKVTTPPIIVDCKMEDVESLLAKCSSYIGAANFTAKILNRSGRVRINPKSRELHQRLKEYLARETHQFHSFTPESERDFTAVILGLYQVQAETVKLAITNAGVAVKAVTTRKTKSSVPLFVARFPRGSTSIKELQEKCGLLCNCVVTWQPFSPAVKEYTQCFNCQQYGHAATNCNRATRCIKCLEVHEKGSCKRTTTEGTAKCVNCSGDHAANYKGCSAYQRYKSSRMNQQQAVARPRPTYVPAPAPTFNFWEQKAAAVIPAAPAPPAKTPLVAKPPPQAAPRQPESSAGNIFAELKQQIDELQQIPNIREIIQELQKLIKIIKSSKSSSEAAMSIAMMYMSSP